MTVFATRLKLRIDELCERRSTNVDAMARDLDIGRSRFRHYFERGSRPDHDTLMRIADYLETDLNWLFGRDVSPDWPKPDQMQSILNELAELKKKL